MKTAAKKSGFDRVAFIEEPVAAAYSYRGYGNNILVFDLGGGTLDLALLSKNSNEELVVKMKDGESPCGGDLMDENLYDYFLQSLNIENDIKTILKDNIDNEILVNCQLFKEQFSKAILRGKESYSYSFILPKEKGGKVRIKIVKKDFEKILYPIVDQILRKLKSFLDKVNDLKYTIDTVVITGGASKLNLLQEKLNELLPVKPVNSLEFDTAVAFGACKYAETILKESKENKELSLEELLKESIEDVNKYENRRAFENIYQLANQGNLAAMHEMGNFFLKGKVVKQNTSEALLWFGRASENNYLPGKLQLANLSFQSEKNEIKNRAFSTYNELHRAGNAKGTLGLAKCFWYGYGTEKNLNRANELFKEAMKSEVPEALDEYIFVNIQNIFSEKSNMVILRDSFSEKTFNDRIEKCKSTYGEKFESALLIFEHIKFSRIPSRKGLILTAKGIAWNNDPFISNPLEVKWQEIDPKHIEYDNKNRLILGRHYSKSEYPDIGNKFETYESFRKIIEKAIEIIDGL